MGYGGLVRPRVTGGKPAWGSSRDGGLLRGCRRAYSRTTRMVLPLRAAPSCALRRRCREWRGRGRELRLLIAADHLEGGGHAQAAGNSPLRRRLFQLGVATRRRKL